MIELTIDKLNAIKAAASELQSLLPFCLEIETVEEYKLGIAIMDDLVEDAIANELLIDILFPIILKYDDKIELSDVGDFFERKLVRPDLSTLELLNTPSEEWDKIKTLDTEWSESVSPDSMPKHCKSSAAGILKDTPTNKQFSDDDSLQSAVDESQIEP
jgi:hypothetical protein